MRTISRRALLIAVVAITLVCAALAGTLVPRWSRARPSSTLRASPHDAAPALRAAPHALRAAGAPLTFAGAGSCLAPAASRVSWQEYLAVRKIFTWPYLAGAHALEGLEIGALQQPFAVPPNARVRYVDTKSLAELKATYPELGDAALIAPDIVDRIETLATVTDASQDFVLASHVIEHAEEPVLALSNMLRVVRTGGVVVLVAPMRCGIFDRPRGTTSIAHFLKEFGDRSAVLASRADHFREYMLIMQLADVGARAAKAATAAGADAEDAAAAAAAAVEDAAQTTAADESGAASLAAPFSKISIHWHSFDAATFLELLSALARGEAGFAQRFEIKEYAAHKYEAIAVLQKL
jgi:SAM-dependent methyltransferase